MWDISIRPLVMFTFAIRVSSFPGDRASRERMVVIVALYILFSSRVLVDIYHELLQMDVEWIEGEEV